MVLCCLVLGYRSNPSSPSCLPTPSEVCSFSRLCVRPTLFPFAQFGLVQLLSCFQLFVTPWTAAHQASLSITNSWSLLNSCPSSRRCHPTISSSPPAFNLSQHHSLFQGVSSSHQVAKVQEFQASASVFPMNIQDWFSLGLTDWISLQSKGLSSLLQHHSSKPSILWHSAVFTNSHIHTWPLEKPEPWLDGPLLGK